jgi:hypothetical protein
MLDGYTGGPLDIGGNFGDDLELFNKKHPGHASQLVLQDLPDKIVDAKCWVEILRFAHDFFTPQPKSSLSARVYYMHSIIHDHSGGDAQKILQYIKEAMLPDYSKLLINDIIILPRETSRRDTSVDVHMMAKLGGKERTDDMLLDLVEGLGLRVRKIWRSDCWETSILEAELLLSSQQAHIKLSLIQQACFLKIIHRSRYRCPVTYHGQSTVCIPQLRC